MQAKPRASVRGCVLTLLFVAALGYGLFAGFGFFWWGRGFAGALAARHAPERIRAASTVYVYDHVIEVGRDRVVFRHSWWLPVRRALLAMIVSWFVAFFFTRRFALAIAIGIAAIAFAISSTRMREVSVPRGAPVALEAQWYEFGGGRVGTKQTTAEESGWQIATNEGLVLVRLPWNSAEDADVWRDLIAEKIASRP